MALRDWSEARKAAVFATAVGSTVIILLWSAAALYAVPTPTGSRTIDVRMRIDGSSWTIWYNTSTPNATVFAVLLEAASARGFTVGWSTWWPPLQAVLVEEIAGDVNGAGLRYWQFWVDGFYADTAADHAELHDGALVEWRFVPEQRG